jgi:hypothetical protein
VAVAVIPERTIDAWTSAEILSFDPFARVWAPTPRSQANREIWDYAVSAGRENEKLFVLENKGLFQDNPSSATHVTIDLVQLARLATLAVANRLPAFYGLPAITDLDARSSPPEGVVGRATLRTSPRTFGEWHRVGPAEDLVVQPRVWAAFGRRRRSCRMHVSDFPPFDGFRRFLARTVTCDHGWNLSTKAYSPPPPSALTSAASEDAWRRVVSLAERTHRTDQARELLLALAAENPNQTVDVIDRRLGQLVWSVVA